MAHVFIKAAETRTVAVQVPDDIAEKVANAVSSRRCLGCHNKIPDGERYVRGLCTNCYQAAIRAINTGKKTESQLVKAGLMAKWSGGGRRPSTEISKRIAEL